MRLGSASLAVLGVMSCGLSVARAHIEPSEPDEITVKRGAWRGAYRLYGERVRMRGTHIHFGEGRQICTGVERRGGQGFGCGFFPRDNEEISVGWGAACEPRPSGFAAGAAKSRVTKVVAIYANGRRFTARLYPSPDRLRFDGQFWLVIHRGVPRLREVRAFGRRGRLLHREKRLNRIGTGVDCH